MIKNFSQLQVNLEGKDFHLNLQFDATFPQIKEALFQFQKQIGAIEDKLKAQYEEAEAAKKAAEENKPPEQQAVA